VGSVVIYNTGLVPVVFARVDVEIRNMLTRERSVVECSSPVMPRSRVVLPFVFESARCGQIVFTASAVGICDFLGLFSLKTGAAPPAPFRRVVAPELFVSVVRPTDRETEILDEATRYLDRKGSDKTEVFQLRDYAEGDGMSQIRWKLTARHGRLIVADPSEPIEHTLLVVWDGAGIPNDAPPSVPDALAEAFVTLCVGLSENGTPFTLAWRSGNTGRTEMKDITELVDLYDAMSELLSPGTDDGEAFDTRGSRPRAVYFSGRTLPEAGEFAARVSAFVCVQNAEECSDIDTSTIVFSPENYRSVLSEMIV
jgi:hypothetical protein